MRRTFSLSNKVGNSREHELLEPQSARNRLSFGVQNGAKVAHIAQLRCTRDALFLVRSVAARKKKWCQAPY